MTDSLAKWQRLSPVSVIFYIGRLIRIFLKDGLTNLLPALLLILSSDNKGNMVIYIAIGVSTLMSVSAVLQYLFFRYRINGNELLIDEGVFKRKHRVINFERIQNINIAQPFYFRPFGLVSLMIETAGAKGDEGNLAGISTALADQIRDQILHHQNQLKEQGITPQTTSEDVSLPQQAITSVSTADLIRYGIANNSIFWLVAVTATFYSQFKKAISESLSAEQIQLISDWFGDTVASQLAMSTMLITAIIMVLMLISIAGAIVKFHHYQLTLNEDTLKRKSGLINTHEESLNLSKIQAISRRSNFISAFLQRENLICRQTSGSGSGAGKRANNFLVPARTSQQCEQIIAIVDPNSPKHILTSPISRRYIIKTWCLKALLPVLLLSSILIYLSNIGWFAVIGLIAPLFYPLVVKRWSRYRFGLTDHYGYIARGFIGNRRVLFPLFKVQRVVLKQSPLQRRSNLATLVIYLASERLTIPYMPIELAHHWYDLIYYRTETDPRPWF